MKTLSKLFLGLTILSLVVLPVVASANESTTTDTTTDFDTNLNLGINFGGYTGLGGADIRTTIAKVINVGLGFLGIVAVIIVLVGGFMYMTSGGEQEKAKKARQVIFAGVIGLVIILSAYALSRFVLEQLQKATSGE